MTPTLLGRWQTRIWLTVFIGGVFTLLYWSIFGASEVITTNDYTLFIILVAVIVLGVVWDLLYNYILRFRWDHDWPPVFQLFAGIIEYLLIWLLLAFSWIPFANTPEAGTWWIFHSHYWLIWITTFIASQGFLRILDLRWRFRGGQFGTY